MHPLWGDSIGKQECRQVKWSHSLVSTAVTLKRRVLAATLQEEKRPLQPTKKELAATGVGLKT